MKRAFRWIAILVVVAAAALLLAYSVGPRPLLVDGALVTRGPLQVSFVEEGKARVIDRYLVSAPVAGIAERLNLDVGDSVQAGQVVLRLNPLRPTVLDTRSRAESEARVAAAQAALESAREQARVAAADAAYWEGELARVRELHASGTIARDKLDQAVASERKAQAGRRSADFQIEVAEHQLEAARTALRYSGAQSGGQPAERVEIRPPVSGKVLRILNESEGVVSSAQPLFEIGDPRALEIEVEVLSSDAVQVKPEMRVLLERWGGDQPLEARVRLVEPTAFTKISALGVEEQRVLVILDIVSPPDEWRSLGDQYRVEARFILWESQDVLQAPANAVFRFEDGWAVFVAQGGQAVRRKIEVGRRGAISVEVLSGLEVGEAVISSPGDMIEDGTSVDLQLQT